MCGNRFRDVDVIAGGNFDPVIHGAMFEQRQKQPGVQIKYVYVGENEQKPEYGVGTGILRPYEGEIDNGAQKASDSVNKRFGFIGMLTIVFICLITALIGIEIIMSFI